MLNDYTRGNGFAGLPAANITVEHSTNAGSSWTTTSVSDLVKCNLVTND
ncbi:MAG: hypothetical protein IJV31_01550 [Clostridia bacterium]|nr:hypothetical protein [Clostridia bacterium]